MRYYIADPHFFHGNLNTKMDYRGFADVEEMNGYMLQKWNAKVRKNDGLGKLNGRLYLIQGNHDRFLKNKDYNASRFVWIKPYEELQDNKRKVILCHYPIMCYNGQYRLDGNGNPKVYMLYGHVHDTYDQRLIEQFQEIIRGSIRKNPDGEKRAIPSNMINCFCMYSDYTPLTLDEWILCDRKRREKLCAEDSMEMGRQPKRLNG